MAELISQEAASGRLHGLTIWPTQDGLFQAGVRREADGGWNCVTNKDPAAALLEALTGTPQPEPSASSAFE